MRENEILGYNVFSGDLYQRIKMSSKKTVINTINPHSYAVAKSDSLFESALKSSDILVPDGSGIVLAARVIQNNKIKKIAGFDIFLDLMKLMEKTGGRVFFMGSTVDVLNEIKNRIECEYPAVSVATYSPPYKDSFSIEENDAIISAIHDFKPDVVFVGMTAPKQEKWVYENKVDISAGFITSIGAVFDFYAGTVKRPSPFWIDSGLEWLPRLIGEPRRLWKRTFISAPVFIKDVLAEKIKKKRI